MGEFKYIYGPVPSRRMGISVGISPIPEKYCNYSCIYCQLGRTSHMSNKREEFFKLDDILDEFERYLKENPKFDVVTIVGEGEPTLYSRLGELIDGIKRLTEKPVAVITNGALLYDEEVSNQLCNADIVLPSLDAYDEETFKKINRPCRDISFKMVLEGLMKFSQKYKGQLWIEIMIIKDMNDSTEDILRFKTLLDKIEYDRLYINSPVRPPAESWVEQPSAKTIKMAVDILGGISIDALASKGFYSEDEDDYRAILSIIKRHPMNQHEINDFLSSRNCSNALEIFKRLELDKSVESINYKGYITYRLKK